MINHNSTFDINKGILDVVKHAMEQGKKKG